MCGIFGWQWGKARPSRSQMDRLSVALAIYNDRRGGHSWGYAPAHAARTAGVGTMAPHAARLVGLPQVIAHTRFATAGAKTAGNAHPFVRERVTGAHNGVIDNHRMLDQTYTPREVDSEHLIDAIDAGRPLGEIVGYGAVEWLEREHPDRVYVARLTNDGDLAATLTRYGVAWSSDATALAAALAAAEIPIEHTYRVDPGACLFAAGGRMYVDPRDMAITPRETGVAGWGHWDRWETDDSDDDSDDDPQEAREALIEIGFSLSDVGSLSDAEAIETAIDLTDFGM